MKRTLHLLTVLGLIVMQACHQEPFLSVSPDSLSFPEAGGSQTIQISANYAWSATVIGSGFSVSPSSGEGNATVTVTASPASSTEETVGTLSVNSEGLGASVSLRQEKKTTIVLGDAVKVPAEGGTVEVPIQYNTDFSVEVESSAQSWLKYIKTRSLSSGALQFEVSPNDGNERSGKVTVKDNAGKMSPVSVTIIQQEEHKVILVGDVATVPEEGGTLEVDVQYNVEYNVEIEMTATSWIHYVETRALTSGKLIFKIDPNESAEVRSGEVFLKDKSGKAEPVSITINQDKKKLLTVGEPATVPFSGGSVYIPVEYNTEYKVEVEESAQSWIRIIRTKAVSSGQIELRISENQGEERTGNITVTDISGKVAPIVLTIVQESSPELIIRRLLMEFYDAMDGPNWVHNNGWGTDQPLHNWDGVFSYDPNTGVISLQFREFGLKGEIPESLGELGDLVRGMEFINEPGITGTIPESFSKFRKMERFEIIGTSMTSLRDCFSEMKSLTFLYISSNLEMKGPLPVSLGNLPSLSYIVIVNNGIEGSIPSSWANLGNGSLMNMDVVDIANNYLSGSIPQYFLDAAEHDLKWLFNILYQKGIGFDISGLDIRAYGEEVMKGTVQDVTGKTFTFDDVIKNNKYTVNIIWASWCPFSRTLMPQLKSFYEKYHKNGLEIIATSQVGLDEDGSGHMLDDYEGYKKEVIEKGYDIWYNYYWPDYAHSYLRTTPNAEVYDQNGYVVFSSISTYNDPERNRFNRSAAVDLIPFLENMMGAAEPEDTYTSKDYSKDGQVMTLQKATVGKGINIVFMGDAYTDQDMGTGGVYETVMRQMMEEFFSIEPYKTFRNRFNVYAVKVVSPNGRIGEGYSTALGTYLGEGTYVNGDNDKCFEYALKVPGISSRENLLVGVIVNSTRNFGTAILYANDQSSVARIPSFGNDPYYFGSTLQHEAGGHGFAFLADEYYDNKEKAPAEFIKEYNSMYDQYGWYANVDFTDDPSKIRWSAFLSDSRYEKQVGIFEGAALYEKGAWRPSANSVMNMNMGGFNAPSRLAIYKQIMKRSGEKYSFEKFLEYDAINRSKSNATAARPPLKAASVGNNRFEPGASPVVIK